MPPNSHSATAPSHPGLAARALAVTAIDDFLTKNQPLDETLERLLDTPAARELPDRDRGLVRAIAMAAIRRLGTIAKALEERIERGLPNHSGQLEAILISGAAQILFLDVPDHAAVDLSVRLVQVNSDAKRFTALSNAVLRRIAREKDEILKKSDPLTTDTPEWLAKRWIKTYGAETAAKIATAFRAEPAIDLTLRADPEIWAEKLNAKILPTGSLRLRDRTPVRALAGYEEGAFWVQDTAAALPVRLLNPKQGETIADLCAAPGGKTAQLALSGAHVTAVDRSEKRVSRLSQNMQRLGFSVDVVGADASLWRGGPFDAILLDAPCTATGTIRRHPDVAWLKSEEDLAKLTRLQQRLLDHSAELLKPGGRLIYCTCSLEPEEGEEQIKTCLARNPSLRLAPFEAKKLPWLGEALASAITPEGFLRTLPFMMPDDDPRLAGLDGFFAAELKKI
ncbi:MAG: 16S rRNA (cytosine(967)-C(5))-methyltransferase RsmB [Hyphomicrobiales bacterium]